MRGRRPISDRQKAEKGTYRRTQSKQHKSKSAYGYPAMPKDLTTLEKKHWRRVKKDLQPMGVVRKGNEYALTLLVRLLAEMEEAMKEIKKTGRYYWSHSGMRKKNPALVVMKDCNDRIVRLLIEFGLTPVSADRVEVAPENRDENEDPELKILQFVNRKNRKAS